MKLLNYTLLYLSATLFAIVSLWAVLFYFQLLNEVKFTIDEGLANYKILIIDKLKDDSQLDMQQKVRRLVKNYETSISDRCGSLISPLLSHVKKRIGNQIIWF